jgi:hypothetical protein
MFVVVAQSARVVMADVPEIIGVLDSNACIGFHSLKGANASDAP